MHSLPTLSFFFLAKILLVFYHLNCEARSSINVRNPLKDNGETLISAGNKFELGFFTPQGSDKSHNRSYVGIWYYKLIPRTIVWVANRDKPISGSCGVFGIDAADGNLKVWCNNGYGFPITNLKKSTTFNRTLQLLDSGNLILLSETIILWQSFDFPTDTFLPGMEMVDNMELTSWISPSDPGRGNYTFRRDQGVYIIQINGSDVYWKSGELGPLGTVFYDDLPSVVALILSAYDTQSDQLVRQNKSPISFPNVTLASYYNNSRLLMNGSGEIQYYYNSSLLWFEPKKFCSQYDACGKFGICDNNNDPMCQCLKGFTPVSSGYWTAGTYSDGCERESPFRQDDEFLNLELIKIGGQVALFDQAQEEATCRNECLNNPKCEAYIYKLISKRAAGDSVAKCYIWTDLENLQNGYTDDGLRLSLRVPFSYIVKSASRICQPCLTKSIPYPLSIQHNCGDPSYSSFYCNKSTGEISFQALGGIFPVLVIYPEKRSFSILVDNSTSPDICYDTKLSSKIVNFTLNPSLPFHFTNHCYNLGANQIKVGIGWEPPFEPLCNMSTDCKDWPNSNCQEKFHGQKKCYCNKGFGWDDLNVNCTQAAVTLQKGSRGSKNKSLTRYVIVLGVLLVGVILVVCSRYIFHWKRWMVEGSGNQGSIEAIPMLLPFERERQVNEMRHETDRAIDVPFYNFNIILSATDNFSDANKLGRGGFGPVYKGNFPGGHEIAVKRLSSFSGQGIDEFLNEVNLIAKLQHRNLVRLLGYGIKKNEKMLLYEYMPNRSLDAIIFDQNACLLLDWKKRFDIILGTARGLLYLHQDSRLRIIHRDLKTSNILLDEEMNPKISDFGLARIIEGKRIEGSTNKVVGTFGYMAPEYALDGKFSIKSDVFSFGVVMLEIISGKKNTEFYDPREVKNLLGYAWRLWTEDKALDLVDPRLKESFEKSQVMTCIKVGLLCVQEDPNDRPSMSLIVIMLGTESIALPNPTKPAFVVRRRISVASSSSSTKPDTTTNNDLTISMTQGR